MEELKESGAEKVIEVESKLDAAALLALSKMSFKYMLILMSIVAAAFVFLGSILLVLEYDLVVCVALIVAGAVVPFLILLLSLRSLPKNVAKSKLLAENLVQNFKFSDTIFLTERSAMSSGEHQMEWRAFFMVKEDKNYYYLYLNKFSAYIVDKKGFLSGSDEELHNLFKDKLKEKYKYIKKLH